MSKHVDGFASNVTVPAGRGHWRRAQKLARSLNESVVIAGKHRDVGIVTPSGYQLDFQQTPRFRRRLFPSKPASPRALRRRAACLREKRIARILAGGAR